MSIAESLLPEIDQETATTKRVLERVPEDKLSWKPHEKSFSLGQLALHVATTPGQIANLVTPDEVELPASFEQSEAQSKEEVLTAHEESVAKAKQYLSGLSDEAAMATWRVVSGGNEVMAAPRIGMIRSLMLNHWYHHRGQLSVYLRLLDVPVPSIYGPSADENPFAPH
jgi:uncharacterized damage-inducible protein DinB